MSKSVRINIPNKQPGGSSKVATFSPPPTVPRPPPPAYSTITPVKTYTYTPFNNSAYASLGTPTYQSYEDDIITKRDRVINMGKEQIETLNSTKILIDNTEERGRSTLENLEQQRFAIINTRKDVGKLDGKLTIANREINSMKRVEKIKNYLKCSSIFIFVILFIVIVLKLSGVF